MRLSNTWHKTEARTRKSKDELQQIYERWYWYMSTAADVALTNKLRRALCGFSGCRCGGHFAELPEIFGSYTPPDDWGVEEDPY